MPSPIGIPSTRVTELFVRQRLLRQMQGSQGELYRAMQQLSTGRRFETASDDADSASRILSLQRLLERKTQVQINLRSSQSYLQVTDTTMGTLANGLAEARAVALGAVGTTTTQEQRDAAAQQVSEIIRQLQDAGNQKFRGRYLFAGSETSVRPFETLASGAVVYRGNETHLRSYSDIDLLYETNFTGDDAFGAISEPVRGAVDLNPVLRMETRLADLHGGRGVRPGSISISDGTSTSVIDLSEAETIGDVVELIGAKPPAGRDLNVELTPQGLRLKLTGLAGNLTVHEVGDGSTASELGILNRAGVGMNELVGTDLNPRLSLTTPVDDLLGSRARPISVLKGTPTI